MRRQADRVRDFIRPEPLIDQPDGLVVYVLDGIAVVHQPSINFSGTNHRLGMLRDHGFSAKAAHGIEGRNPEPGVPVWRSPDGVEVGEGVIVVVRRQQGSSIRQVNDHLVERFAWCVLQDHPFPGHHHLATLIDDVGGQQEVHAVLIIVQQTRADAIVAEALVRQIGAEHAHSAAEGDGRQHAYHLVHPLLGHCLRPDPGCARLSGEQHACAEDVVSVVVCVNEVGDVLTCPGPHFIDPRLEPLGGADGFKRIDEDQPVLSFDQDDVGQTIADGDVDPVDRFFDPALKQPGVGLDIRSDADRVDGCKRGRVSGFKAARPPQQEHASRGAQ